MQHATYSTETFNKTDSPPPELTRYDGYYHKQNEGYPDVVNKTQEERRLSLTAVMKRSQRGEKENEVLPWGNCQPTGLSLYPTRCWPGASGNVSRSLCTAHAGRITLMSLPSHPQHHLASFEVGSLEDVDVQHYWLETFVLSDALHLSRRLLYDAHHTVNFSATQTFFFCVQ
ncbi:hypothetical protein LSAT2_031015 [Lamellibrachia satsuma]|nr:hypothetical protein LSAT2_031015 [Lamellibrachia satsuma]